MSENARSTTDLMHDFLSRYFSNWMHLQQGKGGDPVLALRLLERDDPDGEKARGLLEGVPQLQRAYGQETGSLREVYSIGWVVSGILFNWYYLKRRIEVMDLRLEVNYPALDEWMVMVSTPLRIMLRFAIEYALFTSRRGTSVMIGRIGDAFVVTYTADSGCEFSQRFREQMPEVNPGLHKPDDEEFERWLRLPAERVALRLIVLACDILQIDRPRRRFLRQSEELIVEMHIALPS